MSLNQDAVDKAISELSAWSETKYRQHAELVALFADWGVTEESSATELDKVNARVIVLLAELNRTARLRRAVEEARAAGLLDAARAAAVHENEVRIIDSILIALATP